MDGSFSNDLMWHMKNMHIGAPRNWSKNVLEWNLASDPDLSIHTPGGCTTCLGAVTIDGSSVTRNAAYYTVAHSSKFVREGSIRIDSNIPESLHNVAYKTPSGKIILIILNERDKNRKFNISYKEKIYTSVLPARSVGTFVW